MVYKLIKIFTIIFVIYLAIQIITIRCMPENTAHAIKNIL